jgi:prepilin-type N-terminal cleavage/methylation domain-containing protein
MIIKGKKQKGYGLIEMVAGLALAGILTTGVTTFAVQTITEGARSNNNMQAICQLENAGFWVSRDVQMAENITLGQSAGFPLQLAWKDFDQNEYQVTYNMTDGQIKRTLVENGGEPIQTLIAQSINTTPSLTNLSCTSGLLTFNVTSTFRNSDVSRRYQIKKRLDIQ